MEPRWSCWPIQHPWGESWVVGTEDDHDADTYAARASDAATATLIARALNHYDEHHPQTYPPSADRDGEAS